MKTGLFFLSIIVTIFLMPCCKTDTPDYALVDPCANNTYTFTKSEIDIEHPTPEQYNNTKGYWPNGDLITHFDCPDSKFFPPINLKYWDKIPVVNGRFPTYAETMEGISIHHYGEKKNKFIKPYPITLPKLAYFKNPSTGIKQLVVVIQMVYTAKDTVVGYRYIKGGVGGSLFKDFYFLTNDEVKSEIINTK